MFDEVITGFRLDTGGAQAKYDVRPDVTTFGKVIGGGLPIGAVGGRRDVMETLSPLGPVFHAGTLAGNPLATAAGLAALGQLDGDVYIELAARARHLAALLRDACAAAGFPARFPVVGTLLGIVCGDVPAPVDFAGAKRTDEAAYAAFFQAMLAEGRGDGPRRLRGHLRRPRPHRRRPRRDRRRRPPRRGHRRAGAGRVAGTEPRSASRPRTQSHQRTCAPGNAAVAGSVGACARSSRGGSWPPSPPSPGWCC